MKDFNDETQMRECSRATNIISALSYGIRSNLSPRFYSLVLARHLALRLS